jgi:hypothetical protein
MVFSGFAVNIANHVPYKKLRNIRLLAKYREDSPTKVWECPQLDPNAREKCRNCDEKVLFDFCRGEHFPVSIRFHG